MAYSFDEAEPTSATRRSTSRCSATAASTTRAGRGHAPQAPLVLAEMPAFDDDVWELYGPDDWTQAHDLAAEQPRSSTTSNASS